MHHLYFVSRVSIMMDSWSASLALILVLMSVASSAIPKSNLTDKSALLAFKARITSDPSNVLANNWSSSTSFCNWVGVTCSSRHQRVVALDLSDFQLKGTIPPHLGNLSFLTSIDLENNSFIGSLPHELGLLPRLKMIRLSNNSLTGTVPPSLFNITSLEEMYLMYNFLQGNVLEYIAVGNVSSLQVFAAGNNLFSGSVPPAIFNVSSLDVLSMRSNNLSGTVQADLCNENSRLQFLDFGTNQLRGQIPSELWKCKELQVIALDDNDFSGSIPSEFCNFTQLVRLYLSKNNLKGEIPKEIVRLISLEILAVEQNGLNGSIPEMIGNFTSLRSLIVGGNNLIGSLPNGITNCTLLEVIVLDSNNLSGTVAPEIFGNLHNLRVVLLGGNKFGGSIPSTIFNLSMAEYISLASNDFYGNLPSSIGLRPTYMHMLYLGQNKLNGPIPKSICNASQLVDLDLGFNSFSGLVPDCLGNLRNLQILSMTDNILSASKLNFFSSLTSCKNLVYLAFAGNPLDISLPISMGNFSTSLQEIQLYECRLKGSIPGDIGNISSLILLNLANNELTGTIPETIRELQLLQMLGFRSNRLEGKIPSELCNLERLSGLDLHGNDLYGSIPNCWSNLTSLRDLDLSSNRLTSIIPSAFWKQPYILTANLSSNSLRGQLPLEIGNLKVVTKIDVSGNRLSGKIPTTVGSLKDLTYLSFSENRFEGPIPQSFGDLLSLESLDLSDNNLSGEIPKSLEKLLYLKYFNVSFNHLQGEIPDGGAFANFLARSFVGNEALCGPPRMQVPPCKSSTSTPSKASSTFIFRYVLPAIAFIILVFAGVMFYRRCCGQDAKIQTPEDLQSLATWRRISYHELELATDGFQETNLLGSGSFGSVYRGILSDGMIIAVKVFKLQLERAFVSFDTECEMVRGLRHRNLVNIISSCSTSDFKALVFDFMPNWSLEKWLYSHNYFLDIFQRLNIVIDVASALEYLHHGYATPVVHCDLKPGNVMLDEDMVAHVGDFGISKILGDGDSITHTLTLATIGYMAPEFGLEGIVSVKGDVYSFGVLMMETFTRKKPTDEIFVDEMSIKHWVKHSVPDAITQVVDPNLVRREERHFAEKKECTKSILELALECSADLPEERPGMKDVVTALKKIKTKFLKDVERNRRS